MPPSVSVDSSRLVRVATELVGEHPAAERPEAERHLQQVADDVGGDEVGDVLHSQADFGNAQHQHVAGEPQRRHADQHADTAEAEEQQRLVVTFPAAAVAEAPFAVEDVGRDHRDDAGDDLRRHRLGLQHRELQREEDRRVDDEGGGADDRELDELVVPFEVRPDRAAAAARSWHR